MTKIPGLTDILEAVFECYEAKGGTVPIFTLWKRDVGDLLRKKGFTTSDEITWERLNEFNKTVEVLRKNELTQNYEVVYWLCEPDLQEHEKDKSKGMPFMFRVGVVVNNLTELTRKRKLENEQLHFWGLYKWGVGLAVIGSICAVISAVCAIVKVYHP